MAQPETLEAARDDLLRAGYAGQYETEYDDAEQWRHDRHMLMLSRVAVQHTARLRLATRNAWEITVSDLNGPLRIVGAHLDDRSEDARLCQVISFLGSLDADTPTVLAGDLNTSRAKSFTARFVRTGAAQALIGSLPSSRAESIGSRLAAIASGDTLALLEGGGFRDADPFERPTFPVRFPFLQPDHIMLSNNLRAADYYRAANAEASDHFAVVAKVTRR